MQFSPFSLLIKSIVDTWGRVEHISVQFHIMGNVKISACEGIFQAITHLLERRREIESVWNVCLIGRSYGCLCVLVIVT